LATGDIRSAHGRRSRRGVRLCRGLGARHQSLLLVRYGTLTIEIQRHLAAWSVVAVRSKGNRYPVTERAMDAATVDEAAAKARRRLAVRVKAGPSPQALSRTASAAPLAKASSPADSR